MRRLICLILFLLIALMAVAVAATPAWAQDGIFNTTASAIFGEQIKFQATLQTTQPVKYALLYFQEHGKPRTEVKPVNISFREGTFYEMDYLLDLTKQAVRVFDTLEYRFEVTLQNGEVISGPWQSLAYIDDRYPWQVKQESNFIVHWYQGDLTFAQKALDAAQAGFERIASTLPTSQPTQVDIYIYPNSADMQATLQLAGQNWVAGHADPDLGVIVVTLPVGPDQHFLMEQRIPHELMHVLLYQSLGSKYANLPAWLSEGLATNAELLQNPDYQITLNNAYKNEKLMSLASLCNNFPRDASGAIIAYAQASSLVSYIHQTYGAEKLHGLLNEYLDGVSCESGVQNALGMNLAQLEKQWRRSQFGENMLTQALKKLWPWLILSLAVIAVPFLVAVIWLWRRSPSTGKRNNIE